MPVEHKRTVRLKGCRLADRHCSRPTLLLPAHTPPVFYPQPGLRNRATRPPRCTTRSCGAASGTSVVRRAAAVTRPAASWGSSAREILVRNTWSRENPDRRQKVSARGSSPYGGCVPASAAGCLQHMVCVHAHVEGQPAPLGSPVRDALSRASSLLANLAWPQHKAPFRAPLPSLIAVARHIALSHNGAS